MVLSGIRPSFPSLSRSAGQITHVLLTRSPLEHPHQKVGAFPFDLHVLSTPPAFVLSQDQTLQKNKQKNKTGKKQRNQQNNNKQQTTNTKNHFGAHVHVHIQTKFASSNDTLSSSQTTPPPTTQHPKQARAANSDHTNIQTPPQNHKPPRHNNKNRDGYHAIPVTLLDLCPCEGFLASPQH